MKGTMNNGGGIIGVKDFGPYCHQHHVIRYGWWGCDQIFYCHKVFTKKKFINISFVVIL